MADIVICETDIPEARQADLVALFERCQTGARILLYHALLGLPGVRCKRGIAVTNKKARFMEYGISDRYPTSWKPTKGFPFDIWCKLK